MIWREGQALLYAPIEKVHMKHTCTIIILIAIVLGCSDSQLEYNDWFEMNLKNKPAMVKEVSIFSLTDMHSSEHREFFFKKSLQEFTVINAYHFDSLGWITSKYYQSFTDLDSIGRWSKTDMRRVPNGLDFISLDSDSFPPSKTKYFYKNGFLMKEVYDFPTLRGETVYIRNSKERVIEKRSNNSGVDSQSEVIEKYILNKNNDISSITEIKNLHHAPDFKKIIKNETRYQYLYDENENWIIRLEYTNDTLNRITEREIKYK